jgi:GT2 family glycosyltransferase
VHVDVAIVVVTYNSAHVVAELLDGIPAAAPGLALDVVVVDNGSSDGTVELLRGRTDCRVIEQLNLGYAAGFNAGVAAAADSSAVVVLNPDVRLEPCAVTTLLTALADPPVGIAAPKVLNEDGTLHHSLRRTPSILRAIGLNSTGIAPFSEYVAEDQAYEGSHDVDWALGAVLMISRRCLETVGLWDASYFLYSEETDFCLRAGDLGFRTRFVPDAVARHIGGQSGQNARTHTMLILNRVRLYRRRHGPVAAAAYYGLTVLSEISWTVRGHAHQSCASVRALLRPSTRPPELGCSDRLIPF